MPNTVEEIGLFAFGGCYNLESVKISSSLTELPGMVFNRTKIASIAIPPGITKMSGSCFEECESLKTMICYASTPPILSSPFPADFAQGTLYVPAESVSAYRLVEGWKDWGTILPIVPVESIQVEDISVEKLLSDTLSVQSLPSNATESQIFFSSSNPKVAKIDNDGIITGVEVGETTITVETLDGKRTTCNVTVTPTDLIAVGGIDDVHWKLSQDSVLTVYGTGIFEPSSSGFDSYREYVREARIIDGISLGFGALGWCKNLEIVELPKKLTKIDTYAFYADRKLFSINLPDSLVSIGDYAFSDCYALTHLDIPAGVKSIGNEAFDFNYHLESMRCHSINPPTLGNNAFRWVSNGIPVYVPASTAEAYRADAGWSYFTNIIEESPSLSGDANGDGNVTLADVTPLLSYLLKGNASDVNLGNADVNGDGVVSIGDITALIKKLQDVKQ